MTKDGYEIDLGFIITKAPLESSLGEGFLSLAHHAINNGKTVGFFLISDGVWFVKKNQKNTAINKLKNLIEKGAIITVSKDNLDAAGIETTDILEGITISEKPYQDLVALVMEKWRRVMTI
ncbi:MAG TPA: DsrE family protein [Candidatus Thermoplasmatota archaeon]|jgi:sulfur relay (sulfurtransferase) DsrF/TusC family protein|nr:DsrE family protein [Candidatus Thermoplasmatota archaeon]